MNGTESTSSPLVLRQPRRQPAVVSRIRDIALPGNLNDMVAEARRGGREAYFWANPTRDFSIAAFGSAWRSTAEGPGRFGAILDATDRLDQDLAVDSDCDWLAAPLLLAGFSFAADIRPGETWSGFEPARVVLPEVCIVRRGARCALIYNSADGAETAAPPVIPTPTARPRSTPPIIGRDLSPDPDSWAAAVAQTVGEIRAGALSKLVLARSCHLRAASSFDLGTTLHSLAAREHGCTIFSFPGSDADFVGATPETLVSLQRGIVRTWALAGTAPRSADGDCDRRLIDTLAHSAKDRREHDWVVRGIAESLAPLVRSVTANPTPEIVALRSALHLRTALRARATASCHVLDLVEALHPSPAVGGYPNALARAALARRESMERGWYAAPVGWLTLAGDGEFAVGLRSAVVRGTGAVIFAGAGIVADSDPRAELLETDLKLRPMLSALAGE